MAIRVRFVCGHALELTTGIEIPVCHCGERRVARTSAPPPRFRGMAIGPYAEYQDVRQKPQESK